jgi:hypothetical protein
VKLNYRTFLATVGVALSMAVLLGTPTLLRAQQAAASITGLVTDPSGAPIVNATVTVREVDRGTVWTAKTTAAGVYEFPTVPVGNVEVKAESTGFATELRKAFSLALNQVARVDFQLKVGSVSDTVTVTDAPPLLQTSSTEIGTLIDAAAAAQLPLATRDINQLTLLAPGVLSSNIFAFESPQTTFGTGRPYVNGAREQDNNFILDGMDINQPDNDEVSYTPAPDAVQEFNIITSNAPADYGNYAGGVIVESMKSGTNAFHGVGYEYVRNTALEANTWQDKAVAFITGYGTQTTIPRPALHWNEFGGQVGGPIIKNKLFFFADEESSIYNQPRTGNQNTLVPNSNYYTPSNGQGGGQVYDLGFACTGNGGTFNSAGICQGKGNQLYMPAAGVAPGARQPIPYNQIPVSAVDPVAKALASLPAFQNQVSNLNFFSSGYTHNYQGDLKIDWQASEKDHVMGRYTQMYTHLISSNGTNVLTPNLEREYPLKNIVGDYVRTINPTLVNDFRLGLTIFPANDGVYTSPTSGNVNSQIGLTGVPVNLLPSISMGYGSVGNSDLVEVFHDTTEQLDDSLTWTHGKHSIHTGFEFLHWIMNDTYPGNNGVAGSWSFNGQFTDTTGVQGGADNQYADFLLGLPGNVSVGQPIHFHLANSLGAGYVQDNYLAARGLTLNLGLRYEVVTPRGDRTTSNNINFDKVTGTPQIGENYNTYWGIGDLNPRFGFAWEPNWAPNTVIRGAYDISSFMEGNGISNMAVINPPNELQISQTYDPNTPYPTNTFSQGYSPYQTAPCTASQLIAAGSTGTPSPCLSGEVTHATDPNLRPAMNEQWNLTIQHQFHNNFTASVGYVGNHDTHMADIYWYNQKVLTSGTQQINKGTSANPVWVTVPAVAPGPFMQNLVKAGVRQARFNASDAISNYDALEVTLAQKNYHGLDLQANYTMSKCLTNSLGYFGAYGDEEGAGEQQNEGGGNFFQNEYNPMGDYGKCTIDALHAFNAYGLYDLPFGHGKMFGAGVNRAVNEVIGGWNVSLDTTLRSGFAVTAMDGEWMGSFNPAGASNLTAPGTYVPRPNCNNSVSPNMSYQFAQIGSSVGMANLNPAYITGPQSDGQFGNCGVGTMRGPHLKTADMNINKSFPLTEGTNLVFIAQFINLTNTPIFSIPATWDNNYSSCELCNGKLITGPAGASGGMGPYGLMDGSNPGRQIELALKLNF